MHKSLPTTIFFFYKVLLHIFLFLYLTLRPLHFQMQISQESSWIFKGFPRCLSKLVMNQHQSY